MSLSTVLAKALFDNAAESPEELAFRKGDILMVLEQEQSGSPGWWLCSLHGRQGIAPANRLRLLQTPPPPPPAGPGSDPRRTPADDQVYLSPGPPLTRTDDSTDGAYRSPVPVLGEALYQSPAAAVCRPGELRRAEGGRPRSRSSSGTRPRPDWDAAGSVIAAGRPRSPSLRGRDADALYQSPAPPSPLVASQHHRSLGGLAAESVYLSPRAAGAAAAADDDTYLVPSAAAVVVAPAGPSDGCYLVPRGTAAAAGEDVYQTPTGGGGAGPAPPANGSPQPRGAQETPPALYQSPTPVGAGLHRTPQNSAPGEASPRPQHKAALRPPAGQGGKPGPAPLRGSPLLARQARAPGSPNFARKPPPPAPPVRGVTRKDFAQSAATAQPAPGPAGPQPRGGGAGDGRGRDGRAAEERRRRSGDAQAGGRSRKAEDGRNGDADNQGDDEQVYDTPPSSRWQRPAPAPCDDDSIYNTPRALPPPADQGSEVYDVPTIILSLSSDSQPLKRYSAEEEAADDDDVYSVPTLPGLLPPVAQGDASSAPEEGGQRGQVYSVPGPGKRAPDPGDSSEPDCGIYDMPALAPDVLPPPPPSSSSSSSSSSTRRLSVSSNGSGDVQWRASLPCLVQSVLCSASSSAAAATSRDLAASLADVLSVWKAGQSGEPAPPLQQAWARLSDLLPALSACGAAPPPEALLSSVQRALEDAAALLQTQPRPRLPSQDSLSRRPLPALPAADGKPAGGGGGGVGGGGGMGSRKGSWIQERPLPPTPQPAFPLPPAPPSSVTMTLGPSDGEEDSANEYAGIGLAPPAPAPVPAGDSVGYVKLQGKPEPPPDAPTENGHAHTDTTEPRLSPSPPLPASLSLEDSELLSFYSSQSLAHLSCLADSIDLLFASVQGNQPPRVFVSRGKSLIVTAHKLVFIGDTLSRLLASPDLRTKVTTSGGRLCQALKAVVVATKGAAQNYPSVSATQEMVDRVAELSQHAAGFSGLLQRLAEIS